MLEVREKDNHYNLIMDPLVLNTKQDQDEDEEDSKLNFHISVHYASSLIIISLFSNVKKLGFFPPRYQLKAMCMGS